MIKQQIVEILETIILFKKGATTPKNVKGKLKNIDLKTLLEELEELEKLLAETVDESVTGEAEQRRRTWRPVLVSAQEPQEGGTGMRRSPVEVHAFYLGKCNGAGCGPHIIALDENNEPICDIMIPLKGALPFVDELHQILHAAAERD